MPKRVLLLLLVLLMVLPGCSNISNQFPERDIYNHPNAGFSLQVPKSWEKINEADFGVDFIDRKQGIATNILLEVGGLSYYDIESLAEEVVATFKHNEKLNDVEVVVKEKSNITTGAYRIILESTDDQGHALAHKVFIFDVENGIRYYLLFSAPENVFYRYDYEFEDLAETFMVTMQPQQIYKLIPETKLPEGHPDTTQEDSQQQPESKEPELEKNKEKNN